MSDPTMDQIERGLREMTESRSKHTDEPTELWKRALEISRAEERAGLVHPAADRAERPRGRRLLIALNAVGVAAMILLAAGVWTVIRVAPETEKAGMVSDKIASAKAEATEQGLSIFADKSTPEESVETQLESTPDRLLAEADTSKEADLLSEMMSRSGARSREMEPAAKASTPEAASMERQIARDPTAAVDDSNPGISQMMIWPETGLALDGGDASVMAFGTTLENAEIVIEVADATEAFNAVADLPDADLDEFSTVELAQGDGGSADTLVLNFAPGRLDEALGQVRSLGRVVDENRTADSFSNRANQAVNWAAESVAINTVVLDDLLSKDQGLTEHERMHHAFDEEEVAKLGAVRDAFAEITRRLENTRRSINLSQLRVTIRQAPDSDTIEE